MAERVISPLTYTIVLGVLLVLTVLTVGISFVPLEGIWHIVFGLAIAVCKGALVVLFFMHALYSKPLTWLVICAAGFWILILFGLTLNDYFGRGMLPFPGR